MEDITRAIHHILYLLIVIFIGGMIAGKVASKLKIPDVAVFLLLGIGIGPGLNLISEESRSFTNQFILILGATLILFDGGRNIRLQTLKKVWPTISLLSVPGVIITAVVTGYAAHLFLHIPLLYGFLLASIIASTDPATLIPVFKQVKIRPILRETVESESAFNDATASILTFSVLAIAMGTSDFSVGASILDFFKVALGGMLIGGLIGIVGAYLVSYVEFGFLRDYTVIGMLVVALLSYLLADLLHVSGFMATFVAGLIWGNASHFRLRMEAKQREIHHFSENLTVIMRMLIFILLGSQVDFSTIMKYLWGGLLVVIVLMFIARPLTVFACTLPDRKAKWTWRDMLFMCWTRETGVIPAALSGMVVGKGVPYADAIAAVTFLAILMTILLQASTTPHVARKLGVEE
ncbi:cation:proton antiporter [Aneurinibacillus danicus]|uniref:Transporter monovalent cation:proton antiporter-2 (CPA2) family protein n=1 Tax=Aneurinibacillus danicus TaxID=267746 RepID=A0A511VDA7_9BACL|nr:sodium:proton antiporter [Aneurinibacillus danicus]GEN36809.1 transporter monovalent cation:proton antiporter-2 (CPA2) family protein [Aneurinibacillus danicus]